MTVCLFGGAEALEVEAEGKQEKVGRRKRRRTRRQKKVTFHRRGGRQRRGEGDKERAK